MVSKEFYNNNFNILRLLFAIFVIVTHSFVLSGNSNDEPLSNFTKAQINFSFIGLRGFFIISGFLIFQSFERATNMYDFLWKRFLRIFPGLIAVSIFSIFFIGPILSNFNTKEYFTNKLTWQVFLDSIDLFFHRNTNNLPGVFEKNVYSPEINGSLWTISYEFCLYLGFIFLFFTKNKKILAIVLFASIVSFIFFKLQYINPWFKYEIYILKSEIGVIALYEFGIFFLLGSFFASINYHKIFKKYHLIIFSVSLSIILVLIYYNLFKNFYLFLLVPLILSFGLLKASKFDITNKIGDISFGVYLSGFFIQQFFMSKYPFGSYSLLFLSLLVSLLYGLISWNFIEKPALSFKNKFRKI